MSANSLAEKRLRATHLAESMREKYATDLAAYVPTDLTEAEEESLARLETLREKGSVRFEGWGMVGHGVSQASTIKPDEVHTPLRWHTEDKIPYDTKVRRAQFYIDHEWFLEAGEELLRQEEVPSALAVVLGGLLTLGAVAFWRRR